MVEAELGMNIVLGVVFGTLIAIVYALRILVLLERRIARIDVHIEHLVKSVLKEELKIEKEEKLIERELGAVSKQKTVAKKKTVKKVAKKSAAKKPKKVTKKKTTKKRR